MDWANIPILQLLDDIIHRSLEFVEARQYRSFDPFDALSSPVLDRITRGHPLLRRLCVQFNRRSPVNIRRFLGIVEVEHTKVISDLTSIYSRLFLRNGSESWRGKAADMHGRLLRRRIPAGKGNAWGLNFPYSTRFTDSLATTPNLYNTVFAGVGLLDYQGIDGSANVRKSIHGIMEFIVNELGLVETGPDSAWVRYYPGQATPTMNVNALTASLLVRVEKAFGVESVPVGMAERLISYLGQQQQNDGSWYYASSADGRWIDGFHTGFILESLIDIESLRPEFVVRPILNKGLDYYLKMLFTESGVPKYFHDNVYPLEAQNCAQAIQTLARAGSLGYGTMRPLLEKVIRIVLRYLYDEEGYFYYRKGRFHTDRTFFMRWSQTPMILALLHAMEYLEETE